MESEKIRAVFFDLDGTLVSNYVAIHATLQDVFTELGYEVPSYEKVVKVVGGSILATIEKLIGSQASLVAGKLYVERFPKYIFTGLSAFSGALEILRALKEQGMILACLTNKGQESAEKILQKLGMSEYLDAVIGTSLTSARKPDKEFTFLALEKLGLTPDETILIGDSPYDYQTGQNAGLEIYLTATGGDTLEELQELCPNAAGVYANMPTLARAVFNLEL